MFHLKFGPQLQYPVFFTMASALFNRLTYLGVGVTAVGALSQHIIYDGKLADPLPCRTCGFSSVRAVLLPHHQTVVCGAVAGLLSSSMRESSTPACGALAAVRAPCFELGRHRGPTGRPTAMVAMGGHLTCQPRSRGPAGPVRYSWPVAITPSRRPHQAPQCHSRLHIGRITGSRPCGISPMLTFRPTPPFRPPGLFPISFLYLCLRCFADRQSTAATGQSSSTSSRVCYRTSRARVPTSSSLSSRLVVRRRPVPIAP